MKIYIRYRLLNTWNKITSHRFFMSRGQKKERENNAKELFNEIMKSKFGT
jgi:hypothetical protein